MTFFGLSGEMPHDPFETWLEACARGNPMWDRVDCQYWALSKKQYHGTHTPKQMQAMRGTMAIEGALARIGVPVFVLKSDGAGHNLHHDKRARTVEVLTEFLNAL